MKSYCSGCGKFEKIVFDSKGYSLCKECNSQKENILDFDL